MRTAKTFFLIVISRILIEVESLDANEVRKRLVDGSNSVRSTFMKILYFYLQNSHGAGVMLTVCFAG